MSNWIIRSLEKKAWAEAIFPEMSPFFTKMLERGTRRAVMEGATDIGKFVSNKRREHREDGK